jgi:formyltetrahydrofolate deformylase
MKIGKKNTAVLVIHCPDKKGIVARVTEFIDNNNGNIIGLDEYVDRVAKVFFMRIEWELDGFLIPDKEIANIFNTQIANEFRMNWNIFFGGQRPRMAIFVSKQSHCLFDILSRVHSYEWEIDIPLIVSNHNDLEPIAKQFGIPFYLFPITVENKIEQEKKELELLKKHKVTFLVLARYMQVLSDNFIQKYPNKIINIHHSFLPAFPGAKPYHSAYERGVKIIGATSHYISGDLDAGLLLIRILFVSHIAIQLKK